MRLARLLKDLKTPPTETPSLQLADLLQTWLSVEDYEPHAKPTAGRFYPSGLSYDCDAALALGWLRAPEEPEQRDPRLQITFEIGHAIHERFQKIFIKLAKKRGWTFEEEVRILRDDNPWFISGRADGVFHVPLTNLRSGLEIKSINDNGFKALWKAPQAAHIEQANIYHGILKLHRMHYLYVNKDKSSLKEFILPFDERLFKETMSRLERILLTMQKGAVPPCDTCNRQCRFFRIQSQHLSPTALFEALSNETDREELAGWKPTFTR